MQTKPIFALLMLLLLTGMPARVDAAETGEGVSNFEVILLVDGKKKGDTWINLSAGGTLIEIPAAPVLSALAKLVDKDVISRLEAQVSAQGTLTNKVLARHGVSISINGPLRQVYLGLTKDLPKPKPPPTPDQEHEGENVAAMRAKVKEDSGPWATPPVPALPGNAGESGADIPGMAGNAADSMNAAGTENKGKRDSSLLNDIGWETGGAGRDSAEPKAASMPKPAKTPLQPVELQTYRFDRTRDELFEDVFKRKPPPLPPTVEVTLLVDGKSYGTLWIHYNNEQKRYTFPADPVLNALQGLVKRELWEKLERRAKTQSRFTVEDLIECGFPTVLNTSVFELSTGVPAQLIGTKIHPLSGQTVDPYTVPAYEQSALSAFVNVRLKERIPYYQYNPNPFDTSSFVKRQVEARNQQSRQPVITNLDGAINLKAWVLEGRGILWEKPELGALEVSRQDFRLVHDWPRKSLRLTAGDLNFPTSGFQSFLNIGGVGLSRDFSLQPHLPAYPVKDYEFFLTNPSEVKVFINGTLKGVFQMDQGTHDLKGFPFTTGESEVEIQITDNTGQTQTLNFNFIHEPSLLAKGNSAFSYNIGLPRRDTWKNPILPVQPNSYHVGNYEYDMDHPTVFLDYRRGLSDYLTMEGYAQVMDTAGMVGLDALQAMRIGKVKADAAASYSGDAKIDWAGNLEYTYIPKVSANVSPTSWRFRGEYLGADFFRPGQDRSLLGSLTLAGYYQNNSRFVNMNLGAAYTFRQDSVDFYNLSVSLSKSWGKGWSSTLSMRNTFNKQRSTNTNVYAMVSYYLFKGENSVNASNRIENHVPDGREIGAPPNWDNSTDLSWDYNGSAPFPKNPALNATASFGPMSNDYSGRASMRSGQGIAEVFARRYEPKTSSIIINYTDISLQTSLVYVDGNVAFSRPISNSFLLVKGIENEKSCDILVNPNEMGYDAKSVEWLPGVIPTISPYSLKKVHIEVLNPPFGSNDERTDFTIFPGYKSGYALYMGTEATIIALGTLLLGPGVPAEYQTFTATPMDGKSKDPVMGFTNGAGKFQLTRLKPGRYMIDMEADGKAYSLIMTLPKKTEGIKTVGTLVLKQKGM